MAPVDGRSPKERRIAVLEGSLADLGRRLELLRLRTLVWPAFALVIAALAVPLFGEVDGEDWRTVAGVAGAAGDAESGSVQVFAVLTVIGLVVVGLGSVYLLALESWSVLALRIAAGLTLVAWLGLVVTVASSGDGGAIGDLGYENSIRILLVPIAAAAAIAASMSAGELAT